MLRLLFRLALFLVGAVLLCDAVLPARVEALQVDQHTSNEYRRASGSAGSRFDTDYTLHFSGGLLSSCSVGLSAYGALHDGDAVSVESSRLFRFCARVSRGTDAVYGITHWRLWLAFCGGLLIALAFGLGGFGRDGAPMIEP